MSQPLLELQRLLSGSRSIAGRVVAVAGSMVQVATNQGVVEVAANGSMAVGDAVTIRNSVANRTQGTGVNAPLYLV